MAIELKDLMDMEERMANVFDKRFEMHEKTEMIIYKNIQKVIDKHDALLIGPNGDEGLQDDIRQISSKVTVISTKMKIWTGIFGIVLSGGGMTVLYMVFTGP